MSKSEEKYMRWLDMKLDKLSEATYDATLGELKGYRDPPSARIGKRLFQHAMEKPSFELFVSMCKDLADAKEPAEGEELRSGAAAAAKEGWKKVFESPPGTGKTPKEYLRLSALVVHLRHNGIVENKEMHSFLRSLFGLEGGPQPGPGALEMVQEAITAMQRLWGTMELKRALYFYLDHLRALAEESKKLAKKSSSHAKRYKLAVTLQHSHLGSWLPARC